MNFEVQPSSNEFETTNNEGMIAQNETGDE